VEREKVQKPDIKILKALHFYYSRRCCRLEEGGRKEGRKEFANKLTAAAAAVAGCWLSSFLPSFLPSNFIICAAAAAD
jgi:hypothetical protein